MSDDLVKRLRDAVTYDATCFTDEAADRIEALTAERDALAERLEKAVRALRGHQLWTHAENVDGEFVLWAETGEVLMRLLPTHRHQNLEPAAVEFVIGDLLDLLNARATLAQITGETDD